MLRSSLLAAVLIIGVPAMTTACGRQSAGSSAAGPTVPAPAPATTPAQARCTGVTPSPPGRALTLHLSDNGASLCIAVGTGVLVYLRGTPAHMWSHIRSSSAALAPRANGRLMLQSGVTGGYFVAAHPGLARLTSQRMPCTRATPPGSPATSAGMECGVVQGFTVTLTIVR